MDAGPITCPPPPEELELAQVAVGCLHDRLSEPPLMTPITSVQT